MATLAHATTDYTTTSNWFASYQDYVAKAEFNRIGWAATAVALQGCILSPVLLLVMFYFGGGDWQFLASMLCFLAVLVPVLSALPVKYIFPAFTLSFIIHIVIILLDIL